MGHELRELYGGCYRRLAGSAFALTGEVAAAEECVQAAFVEALGSRIRFGRQDDPEAWLRTAALTTALRLHRGSRNGPRPPVETPNSTATALLNAIRTLGHGDQDITALGVLAGLQPTEIARLVSSSPARVETRLTRGRKHLDEIDFGLPLAAAARETRIWVEQAVDAPPFEQLQLIARRRRRRHVLTGAAAVVVLVAAAVSVPAVVREHRPGPLVPVTQIKFTDRNHGYALIQPCSHGSCALRIARTVDGGEHWSQINIPHGPLKGMSNGIALGVCCGNRLSVSYSRLATAAERNRHEAASNGTIRIHAVSHDNGKHWTSARDTSDGLQVGDQTTTIPTGWLPLTDYGLDAPTVVAVNAVDDLERPLQHQPNLVTPDVSVPFRQNERIWATGGPTRDQLMFSDDEGRSWHHMNAPRLAQGQSIAALFPRPQGSVYVQTRLDGGTITGPTYRLDQRGKWTRLPGFGLDPDAVVSQTLPDGELWISDSQASIWRTQGAGTKVVAVHGPKLDGKTARLTLAGVTPDGTIYAQEPPGGRQDVVFSSRDDGRTWSVHDIRLPRSADP
ncbi:MAG TPA: sigma factor [Mycobacteriales bacterium]|nr:sigma factor [Mycobacteriales bacterium]